MRWGMRDGRGIGVIDNVPMILFDVKEIFWGLPY
jgi:hypothetical protein